MRVFQEERDRKATAAMWDALQTAFNALWSTGGDAADAADTAGLRAAGAAAFSHAHAAADSVVAGGDPASPAPAGATLAAPATPLAPKSLPAGASPRPSAAAGGGTPAPATPEAPPEAPALSLEDLAVGDPLANPALAKHLLAIGEVTESDLKPPTGFRRRISIFRRTAKAPSNVPVLNDILVMQKDVRAKQVKRSMERRGLMVVGGLSC